MALTDQDTVKLQPENQKLDLASEPFYSKSLWLNTAKKRQLASCKPGKRKRIDASTLKQS